MSCSSRKSVAVPPRRRALPTLPPRRALPELEAAPAAAPAALPPCRSATPPRDIAPRSTTPVRTAPLAAQPQAQAPPLLAAAATPPRKPPPPLLPTTLGTVHITVLRAEGLVAADKGGTSDPFVELFVKQQGRPQKERTPVAKATVNPTWAHGNTFSLAVRTGNAPVCLTVWDHDTFSGNDFLGEALLQLNKVSSDDAEFSLDLVSRGSEQVTGSVTVQARFDPDGGVRVLRLESSSRRSSLSRTPPVLAGMLQSARASFGQPGAAAAGAGLVGSLRVTVHRATGLLPMDKTTGEDVGTSDPYVRLVMQQGGTQVHETTVVNSSLNPVWYLILH